MASLPTGTVTFLFTDIEGSTRLAQAFGDHYADLIETHRKILREAVEAADGYEFETQGDGTFVAFRSAASAVAAAVAAQRALHNHPWPEHGVVRVRMGVHTGTPVVTGDRYSGLDLHRTARICQAGHGGQVLVSKTTRDMLDWNSPADVILRDLGEHRLKDLQRPERIYEIVIVGMPADFPPLNSLSRHRHNLPAQTTSFIGRDRELAELTQIVGRSRMVTLVGPGGCGKTRLALRVAAELVDAFPDGVWLVDLASRGAPSHVVETMADVLYVREEAGQSLAASLEAAVRPKCLLVVLDNCEHLLAACAEITDRLMRACPAVSILATSREVLGASSEEVFPVATLAVPDLRRPPAFEQIARYDAVRLFFARAESVLGTAFPMTEQTALTVARICQRLDGIPLAIELAARWVAVLSVSQIEARLEHWFRLLTGGSPTALPRHRTLLATMEWSHNLLSHAERILLRRVSVFAGGFTLDAAEAICAIENAGFNILEPLRRLVRLSLVGVRDQGDEKRYGLLQTIREYAWSKLDQSGEAEDLRRRHCEWYTREVMGMEQALRSPQRASSVERLEADYDNLRAAAEWSLQSAQPEWALRLSAALWVFWVVRGYYTEGRRLLEEALRRTGAAPAALRAEALRGLGDLAIHQGDFAIAMARLEESLTLWRRLGDSKGIAYVLNQLGNVMWHQRELERAAGFYQEALELFEQLEEHNSVASSLNNLGVLATNRGDFAEAMALLERSLTIKRRLGSKRGIAMAAANLGVAAFRRGDYRTAQALLLESVGIDREMKDTRGCTSELEALGLLEVVQGRTERAARILGAAEASRETIGTPLSDAERINYDYDRHIASIRESLGDERLSAAWAAGRTMSLEEAIDYAVNGTTNGHLRPE